MMSGKSTLVDSIASRKPTVKKQKKRPKASSNNYITITHQNIELTYLRFAKTEIDGESQWVVAGIDFANILTHITNQRAVTSRTFPQAGVAPRKIAIFGYGQPCNPLTAFDACQYLSHITKKHEKDRSIVTNAIQLFTQLLIIKIDDSTITAMWRLDLTKIKSIALPHTVPWLMKKNNSTSVNKNESLKIPDSKSDAASMEIESKTSRSTISNKLSASAIDAAILQLSAFSDEIKTASSRKKILSCSPPLMDTTLDSGSDTQENCIKIAIIHRNILITNLRFVMAEIDEKAQWVVAKSDFAYILIHMSNLSNYIISRNSVTPRDSIQFESDFRDRPLTADDACLYLYTITQKYIEEPKIMNAAQLFNKLLLIKTDSSTITATWRAEPKEINSIDLPHPVPLKIPGSSHTISTVTDAKTTLSATTDEPPIKSIIDTALMQLAAFAATKSKALYKIKEPIKKKTSTTATVKSLLASSSAITSPPVANPSPPLPTQSSTAETKIAATPPLSTSNWKKYQPKTIAVRPKVGIENLLALAEAAIQMETTPLTGKRILQSENKESPLKKRQKR